MTRVEPATPADLAAAQAAYADGRQLQRDRGAPIWPAFADASVLAEIAEERLFRVVDSETLVGVFTVAYADPAIWGERERGAHLYLHRVARVARGGARVAVTEVAIGWALDRCRALGRAGVRVDTWANNAALVAYYERLGFARVAERRLAADPRLPPHYHGLTLALLERPYPPATPHADAHA